MTALLACRDTQVLAGCLSAVVASALALALLANPRSFLSRLVDRGTTTKDHR